MSGETDPRVEALYREALAVPSGERWAFIKSRAGDDPALVEGVLALLVRDTGSDATVVSDQHSLRPTGADAGAGSLGAGARLGPWRLVRELGAGGMGTVFLAERADAAYRQLAAVKLLRGFPTREALAQFRRERQLLADLAHPNICRLLDGGETDAGQPYLVMEYVDGEPLAAWLARTEPDLATRLRLIQALCAAVHHAHRNLIVHRDLKPANVMVRADGQPVLLDFGIGKLLGDDAQPAAATRVFTPAYASPEQWQGLPVTTATDVYGLGLLLFETLTGSPAFDGRARASSGGSRTGRASQAAARADAPWIRREAPRLRGELDTIVQKALAEEPERRYASAAALAADLERWFRHEPLEAAPDSIAYRARKFVARHPVGVVASAAAIATIVGISIHLAVTRERALVAEATARIEAETAREVTEFVVGLFEGADPAVTRGRAVTARELLDRGAAGLDANPPDRPEVRARLLEALGGIYITIGQGEIAARQLDRAVALLRARPAPRDEILMDALRQLSRAEAQRQRHVEALAAAEEAAAIARERLAPRDPRWQGIHNTLGVARRHVNDYAGAQASFEAALASARAQQPPDERGMSSALHNLGWLALNTHRDAEGVAILEQALALKQRVLGPDHPSTFVTQQVLGMGLRQTNRLAEATALFAAQLDAVRRVHGDDSNAVVDAHNELGNLLLDQGRLREAERHFRDAIAIKSRIESSPAAGVNLINNLASALEEREDYVAAEDAMRRSLAIRIEAFGERHLSTARARHNLARVLLAQGRLDEALSEITAAIEVRRALALPQNLEPDDSALLRERIRLAKGEPVDADAVDAIGARYAAADPRQPMREARLAELRALAARRDRDAEGERRALSEAIGAYRTYGGDAQPRIAVLELALARNALARGDRGEARRLLASARPLLDAELVDGAPSRRAAAELAARLD
jgi:serine/threonine-protein kinase